MEWNLYQDTLSCQVNKHLVFLQRSSNWQERAMTEKWKWCPDDCVLFNLWIVLEQSSVWTGLVEEKEEKARRHALPKLNEVFSNDKTYVENLVPCVPNARRDKLRRFPATLSGDHVQTALHSI